MGSRWRPFVAGSCVAVAALGGLIGGPPNLASAEPTATSPRAALAESSVAPAPAPEPTGCSDLLVITARGSGESYADTITTKVSKTFVDAVGARRTVTTAALQYEAAPMQTLYDDLSQVYAWGGTDWNYFESVNSGWLRLSALLDDASSKCPHQKWLLVGYSQGALVVTQAVQNYADSERFAGIVLIANPARRPTDQQRNLGTADPGNGLDGWFHLGYSPLPAELASVTTDLCDSYDNVCDTTHLLADLPIDLPIDLVMEGFARGGAIHTTAYTAPRLAQTAQPAIDRALAVPVPLETSYLDVACIASGDVIAQGKIPLKELNARGTLQLRWGLTKVKALPAAMTGASLTNSRLSKGSYELILADGGSYAGTLPPGHYELETTLHTDVGGHRTVTLVLDVLAGSVCGGVSGYLTDPRGNAVEGADVSLELPPGGAFDPPTGERVASTRTDARGYFSFAGAYSGQYVVHFSDGPPSNDKAYDFFDQYYSTAEVTDYSALPGFGTRLTLGDGSVSRADQLFRYSSVMELYFYDAATRQPIEGINVSGGGGPGFRTVSDETGWARHQGLLDYSGNCMTVYDPEGRYVEIGVRYYSTLFNPRRAMYQSSFITGTVHDSKGKPIVGATVELYRDERWANPPVKDYGNGSGCLQGLGVSESERTTTDASGRYVFTRLYGGDNYFVSAYSGAASTRVGPSSVKRTNDVGGHLTVDLTLGTDSSVRPVERRSGADRYSASAAISAAAFSPGVPVAFVASGIVFPDALSGAPVAAKDGGPVLLVPTTGIPASIAAELNRLQPKKIVILGGPGSVSESTARQLDAFTTGAVERRSGADRYSASAAISAAAFSPGVPVAFVASGIVFPDALSGAPVAAKDGGPVLLVPTTGIPASIAAELNRLQPEKIVILGGPGSVSESTARQLDAFTTGAVERRSGADRYSASAAISAAAFSPGVPVAFVASGIVFPDALSGAPVAAKDGGPVLLVPTTGIPASIAAELNRLQPEKIVILGGPGSVSESTARQLGIR